MIDKTRLGIPLFDDCFGGIYRKRPVLCVGRHHSGKTLAALQAVMQSMKEGERGLMLSSWHAHDLTIMAEAMGFPFTKAVESRQVILLGYADIMPTPEFEKGLTLPPGSFLELQEIVEANGISRVVIDTVLPWVAIRPEEKLPKHIYSFVRAFERMGVTAVFTLPKPVSAMAFSLKSRLEEQIPVVFSLDVDSAGRRSMAINKYLGEVNLPPPVFFSIVSGAGFVLEPAAKAAGAAREPATSCREPRNGTSAPAGPIRFAAAGRKAAAPAPEGAGEDRPGDGRPIRYVSAFRQ